MTAGEVAQIITACAALIGACGSIGAALVSVRNGRKMDRVERATDGIVEKLGASKLAQGDAEGHARGLEEGRQE